MSAAILVNNLTDAGTLTASGSTALNPASNLQNEHTSVTWRVNGTSGWVVLDLGALTSVDTLALTGVTGTNPIFRARFSTVDATGAAGNAHDSGSISGIPYFDPNYRKFIYLLAAPVSARYIRYDVSEAGTDYQEAGRLVTGLRNVFSNGIMTPHRRAAQRRSVLSRGVGGSTFVDRRKGNWVQQVSAQFLSETERTTFIDTIGVKTVNQGHADFLMIPNTDSTNLARDCIWGFQIADELSVTQSVYTVPPMFKIGRAHV